MTRWRFGIVLFNKKEIPQKYSFDLVEGPMALTSSGHNRLFVPTTLNRAVLASGGFQKCALKIWNDLPQHLHDLIRISGAPRDFDATIPDYDNINSFKIRLKILLITQAYNRTIYPSSLCYITFLPLKC